MSSQDEEPHAGQDGAPVLVAEELPPQRVVGPGLWAFTVLLAVVGGAAVLLAVGIAAVFAVVRAGDPGLNQAVSRLTTAATGLPGVRSVDIEPGLGDLGTTPVDLYGDVQLGDTCTLSTLRSTTVQLREIMARETTFQWHPTVWCDDRGLTVSPVLEVTEQRLAIVDRFMQDPSLHAAAAIVRQSGDDPSPDLDDDSLQVQLYVGARTSSAVARAWLERLAPSSPAVTVIATTGRPGDSLDPLALQDGQWTVAARAGDSLTPTTLRTAARIEKDPAVRGAYVDAPGREVAVLTSGPAGLRDLERTLRTPEAGDRPLRLTITLEGATR